MTRMTRITTTIAPTIPPTTAAIEREAETEESKYDNCELICGCIVEPHSPVTMTQCVGIAPLSLGT